MLRQSLKQAVQNLRSAYAADGAALLQLRGYARVPGDLAESNAAKFPSRRLRRPASESSAVSSEAATGQAVPAAEAAGGDAAGAAAGPAAGSAAEPAFGTTASIVGETQRESARVATNFMFPWERRQMEGGKLKTWEKFYWGVFAVAMASLLFNRVSWKEKEPPKVDEEKEARKAEQARLMLAGKSFLEDEDTFKGMTPQEIEEYIAGVTKGAKADDPFEGMSPEEINEYVAKHGMPAALQ